MTYYDIAHNFIIDRAIFLKNYSWKNKLKS